MKLFLLLLFALVFVDGAPPNTVKEIARNLQAVSFIGISHSLI